MSSKTDLEAIIGCGLTILFAILIVPFVILLNGFVLSKLWLWFLVPIGFKEIGVLHAAGIAALVTFLCRKWHEPKSEEKKLESGVLIANLAGNLLRPPTVALGLGFVLKSLM